MAKYNIDAYLHRFEDGNKFRSLRWVRHYARIETALRRATEFLVAEGKVGDVIEFVVKINERQAGVAHLKLDGQIEIIWNTSEVKYAKTRKVLDKGKDNFSADALQKFLNKHLGRR
jgi:hypothetical protein